MSWAREQVERGLAGPGAAFLADAQTAGRGRHGRTWLSPRGKGVYLTVVLPGRLAAPSLTLVGAVAVADAAEEVCGIEARIKWPNDLLWEGRKWGGLLAESVSGTHGPVLLGIGVNVNQDPADFPPDLVGAATSLALAAGRPVGSGAFLAALFARLEARLAEFTDRGFAAVAGAYRARAAFRPGDVLEIAIEGRPAGVFTFRDLDAAGALLVEEAPQPLSSGTVLRVRSGG